MVDLTATLPDENRGKSIIQPPAVYSPLEGIAQGISGIFGAFQTRDNNARAQTKFSEDQIKFQQDQADRAAINATAKGVASIFGPPSPPGGSGISFAGTDLADLNTNAPNIPPEVVSQANDIQKAQAAVGQGRMSSAGYQMAVGTLLSSVQRQFPESAGTIFAWLHSQGIDHYLTREADLQLKTEDSRIEAVNSAQADLYKKATTTYGYTGHSYEDTVNFGAQMASQEQQFKLLKDKADLLASTNANDAAQRATQKDQESEANKNGVLWVNSTVDKLVLPSIDQLAQAYAAAASDPKASANLESSTLSLLTNAGAQMKAHVSTLLDQLRITDPAQRKIATDHVDDLLESVKSVWTGPTSQVAVNQRALTNIKTQYGLDAITSYQVYNHLSAIFGQQAVNAHLDGTAPLPLSPEMGKALTAEINAIKVAPDANSAQAHLMLMDQVISGKVSWGQVPSEKQPEVVRGLVTTTLGNEKAILSGDNSAVSKWANSYGNLVLAGASMQRGTSDIPSLNSASVVLGSNGSNAVLERLIKDPTTQQQGLELMAAKRATQVHLLNTTLAVGPSNDKTGVFSVQLDPKSGLYVVHADRQAYDQYVRDQNAKLTRGAVLANAIPINPSTEGLRANLAGVPSFGDFIKRVPPDLQQKVTTLNYNLLSLSGTAKYDENLPKGMTPVQVRQFYATGQLPDGVKLPSQGTTPTEANLDKVIQGLSDNLRQLPTMIANSPETTGNTGAPAETRAGPLIDQISHEIGIPSAIAHIIIGHESSFNPNADVRVSKPPGWEKSHAYGYTQLQPGTAHAMGLKVPGYDPKTGKYTGGPNGSPLPGDERADPEKNIRGGLTYFKSLVDKHKGDVAAAAREYSGGQWSASMINQLATIWNSYQVASK